MKKYSIGIDYGTLSARALLVDMTTGAEVAVSEFAYPHAVIEGKFLDGSDLEKTTALQHPQDYLDALKNTLTDIIAKSGISTDEVAGIGLDFTSCTVLPVTEDGTPLCFLDEFKNNPQAYVKLWKHHSAQPEADEITALAEAENAKWLDTYGKKVSSEWIFPKIYETLHKAPEVYEKAFRFVEAADWLTWQMTGIETHSSCMAGYKGLWNKAESYPSNEFWGKLDSRLGNIIGTKISENVLPTGTKLGEINESGSKLTGLSTGTAVAVPIIDAHAALPAAGIVDGRKLMMIIGTSTCHIVMSEKDNPVDGICGSVTDGIIPGLVAYEAGQACVGDSFDWFIKNCVPESYATDAKAQGKNIFAYVTEKAEALNVGESGILALDWWNGNRTPLADYDLTGMILGLTLQTKPEEIFRGIIESTAFGTKAIVDLYENNGVEINEVYAAGGISQKNALLMQIYADVLGKEIKIASSTQAGAKGSAIFASVAGGYFDTVQKAADVIADKCEITYTPNPEDTKKYEKIYREYVELTDYFGRGGNDVLKRLRNI